MLTYQTLRDNLPEKGLFRDSELPFLLSPEPYVLSPKLKRSLERLGRTLLKFQMASDRLYKRSKKGTIPSWIANTLDAGKPQWMLEAQEGEFYKNSLPRVIRPDLLLTSEGFALTELDSVPGGMGVTAWLSEQYKGVNLIGSGMLDGFRSLSPEGMDIHISRESLDYYPEMQWLVDRLGSKWSCVDAESTQVDGDREIYRFFELFDWQNLPFFQQNCFSKEVTPPLKPHLEEKLWLSFFHTPSLSCYWAEELRQKQIRELKELIPYGWVVDPTELPFNASLPKLEVHSWDDVAKFSQKERQLVLKVSGFSELAWGSRGVTVGHDVSASEWQSVVAHALNQFGKNPYLMQQFAETQVINHPYFEPETGNIRIMKGRARLCPYYFVSKDYKEVKLGGVLVTINPADKKKIHGMRDGILTVAA